MRLQTQKIIHFVFAVAIGAALIGCDSSSEALAPSGIGGDSQSEGPTTTVQHDPSACASVWDTDVSIPTVFIDTSAQCDYLLKGRVDISALLTIEPGVVIRAAQGASIDVEGGGIHAIGNAQNRIVFEGLAPTKGFWRGIEIKAGNGSVGTTVLDYVDVRDMGVSCTTIFCPDVGFLVNNTRFSITNSSVSNSGVFGLSIEKNVAIDAFSNNRFFDNAINGLSVSHVHVPFLDVNSDYFGLDNPNGRVGIAIHTGDQVRGQLYEWKALNAPYVIRGFFSIEGGTVRLLPGVTLLFEREAWLQVEGNGQFQSIGTEEFPVVIRGYEPEPGYWDSIYFTRSWNYSYFVNTVIAHSGNSEGFASRYAGVYLSESTALFLNTTFVDNARWGISCIDPDFSSPDSVITDSGGNVFENNGSGSVNPHCIIR